ncbi:hypothetical protein P167DRAFT_190960 [Morchella conica CCBAS932]|uniref:Uncharacterized protein n=1 Tax=Morchella conica CCBAS932 TaxID=1392247 RepID=A0A3N4L1P9_9PEZI|nr:hypothetical protein P167DRAFT_190960 [Morchella conica CCBAS932]
MPPINAEYALKEPFRKVWGKLKATRLFSLFFLIFFYSSLHVPYVEQLRTHDGSMAKLWPQPKKKRKKPKKEGMNREQVRGERAPPPPGSLGNLCRQ